MKIERIDQELTQIINYMIAQEQSIKEITKDVHPDYLPSAKNLYRYMILRSIDLRKFHDALSDLGLSSMRTGEGYVFSNIYNVVKNLRMLQQKPFNHKYAEGVEKIGYRKSKKLLKKHANKLFNETKKKHFTEIMVTLPNESAEDHDMIKNMVKSGMEIARINLSHGNLDIWKKMVDKIQETETESGEKVKIYMDLSGPKIRTSTIEIRNKKGKVKQGIPIQKGEHIILTKRDTLGKKSIFGKSNEQLQKAEISVMLPEIISDAQIGDVVLFDDGMIKSKVINKGQDELELIITAAYKNKLSSHKGINLPNTKLNLPALTSKDIENLPFVCQHADMVGYSFVRTAEDVAYLYEQLKKYECDHMGVIFKIENKEAFENLPEILIEGMKKNKIGVMIARGDLAVEIGFEKISEIQNQILWICEAAHIPVIWATQVLENLAKTGMPTRAEITDAAMGHQAECVMLNKGPYINDAIKTLKSILEGMENHSFKRKNELRPLSISEKYLKSLNDLKDPSIS